MSKIENIQIQNCNVRNVPATKNDVSSGGDNDFHCPVTGEWVSLTLGKDNKLTCGSKNCDYLKLPWE